MTAYKKWRKEPDPDAPPPKWLTMLEGLTPLRALLLGFGFILIAIKLWVFTLGALLIIPIVIRLLLPQQGSRALETFGGWLEKHNDRIVMVVSLIFGLLFLYQGVMGFI